MTSFFKECGFRHSRMDIAFMVLYHDNGDVAAMLVLHVDDMMISHDGSKHMKSMLAKIKNKYPFGEWVEVSAKPEGISYTGRQIRIQKDNIQIRQMDYTNGRMENPKVPKQKSPPDTDI